MPLRCRHGPRRRPHRRVAHRGGDPSAHRRRFARFPVTRRSDAGGRRSSRRTRRRLLQRLLHRSVSDRRRRRPGQARLRGRSVLMTVADGALRVLVVGGGGREQAMAWACRRHGHEVRLAPSLGDASPTDTDLVLPGPEQLLVDGIADECIRRGLACFGPTADLARLESSKSWARGLAADLGIPGPRWARFDGPDGPERATTWWRELGRDVVVKLDGLAAGKGVTVPGSDAETLGAIAGAG